MGTTCKSDLRIMATMLTNTAYCRERSFKQGSRASPQRHQNSWGRCIYMLSQRKNLLTCSQAELDQVAAYHRQGGTVGRRWANSGRRSCAKVVFIAERFWNFQHVLSVFMIFMPLSLNHEPPSWMPTRTDEFFLFSFVSLQKRQWWSSRISLMS